MMKPRRCLTDPFPSCPATCWYCGRDTRTTCLNALSRPHGTVTVTICDQCLINLSTIAQLARVYNLVHHQARDWSIVGNTIKKAIQCECGTDKQKEVVGNIVLRLVRRACEVVEGESGIPEPMRIQLTGNNTLGCANLLMVACSSVGLVCIPVLASDVLSGAAWRALCSRSNCDTLMAGACGVLVVVDGHWDPCSAKCSIIFLERCDCDLWEPVETIHVG